MNKKKLTKKDRRNSFFTRSSWSGRCPSSWSQTREIVLKIRSSPVRTNKRHLMTFNVIFCLIFICKLCSTLPKQPDLMKLKFILCLGQNPGDMSILLMRKLLHKTAPSLMVHIHHWFSDIYMADKWGTVEQDLGVQTPVILICTLNKSCSSTGCFLYKIIFQTAWFTSIILVVVLTNIKANFLSCRFKTLCN